MSVDLTTTYLGLRLKNPLVVAACPLSQELDTLRRLEAAGAAAAVLPSLFQEQIEHEEIASSEVQDFGTESFPEALTYFPEPEDYRTGPRSYLDYIAEAKRAVSIPIIASLNGATKGGWCRYARLMQDAGADALELNVYYIVTDPQTTGAEVESRYVELVAAVKQAVSIPLAVKIGPNFSATANMAQRLAAAGADGLVLFNRYLQPDIDLKTLSTNPQLVLSTPDELSSRLRWIAVLHGRVSTSLAATGGIHDAAGLLKVLLAGADVGMVASVLYTKGIEQVEEILSEMTAWLKKRQYESVEQLKGSMSLQNCPDPAAFARGNYMKALTSFTGKPI